MSQSCTGSAVGLKLAAIRDGQHPFGSKSMNKLKYALATAALTAALPASAASVVNYQIRATITETQGWDLNSPNPVYIVTRFDPAVYSFSFDADAPHRQLFGDFMHYGMSASVNGSTLSFTSGDQYPGYGGLYIDLYFDHDLNGKLPVGEQPVSLSWVDINSSANGSLSYVGSDMSLLAVPEPATWAMMLSGFGMIGFAARRRQRVKTTIRYA